MKLRQNRFEKILRYGILESTGHGSAAQVFYQLSVYQASFRKRMLKSTDKFDKHCRHSKKFADGEAVVWNSE